ncbi:MAG: hypothetical protein WD928_03670 [Gammaproteobacteria bacterium]
MAESRLRAWLAGSASSLVWVEFEAYARRVFAAANADWYGDATSYAAALGQAQAALGSDCTSFDLLAPYLTQEPQGKDALLEALGAPATAAFIDQVLDALLHRHAGKLDLVLLVRAPADLLGRVAAPSFDDLDDIALALTELIRRHAQRPLAGLVIDKQHGASLSADEVDAYEPLIGAARHYHWVTGCAFAAVRDGTATAGSLDLDLLLFPETPLERLPEASAKLRYAGGLDSAFWAGHGAGSRRLAPALAYGRIPALAEPETVLSALRELRT